MCPYFQTHFEKSKKSLYNHIFRQLKRNLPPLKNPELSGIFIREVKAHNECIVSLSSINLDIGGLVTCSTDQQVKIWSLSLDLWGTID